MSTAPEPRDAYERVREMALSEAITPPTLPEIRLHLICMLENPGRAEMVQIVNVVRADPALTAGLLRRANSAMYSGFPRVQDVPAALSRVGLDTFGELVAASSRRGEFAGNDPFQRAVHEALWNHSAACALAARHLARAEEADPEESYLAGLLHDIGKFLILKALDYAAELDGPESDLGTLFSNLPVGAHAELGADALEAWGLPDSICRAVRLHHGDPEELTDLLALRIQAADAIVHRIGEQDSAEGEPVLSNIPALDRLGLIDLRLQSLVADLNKGKRGAQNRNRMGISFFP